MLSKGQVINNTYEIQSPIGEGGAGEVYLAWHQNLRKQVVVKRIKDAFVGRIDVRLEADILKRVKHRFITQVYDYVEIGNEIYTIMDYIDGNTLSDYIKRGIRFDEYQIITWLRELSEALSYLHSLNPAIIHNDIKPSNIMIDTAGHICLIDFNISADNVDSTNSGGYTRNYASPEQMYRASLQVTGGDYQSIKLDNRSDIFSLGASIYHIMTLENPVKIMENGRGPFDSPQPYSELLMEIVAKCLERNPNNRYQNAESIIRDIDSIKVRDSKYRRLKLGQTIFTLLCIVLIGLGSFLTSRGLVIKNEEVFYAVYDELLDEALDIDYDTQIDNCLELLNDGKYQGVYKNNPSTKANLLYIIANCYFETEDYSNAIEFYNNAIEFEATNPDYFRDYAIAAVRQGDIALAKDVLEEGKRIGLKDVDLSLAEAEIYLKEGDYSNAINKFNEVMKASDNDNTRGRSYRLCARAYKLSGDYEKAKDTLTEGINVSDNNWKLRLTRELGNLCIDYIQNYGKDDSMEYIIIATDCYNTLTNSDRAQLSDYINLETFCEMLGDFNQAEEVLNQAKDLYPDAYQIPMRQAFVEIQKQSQLQNDSRDYTRVKQFYDEASKLYEPVKNSGNNDEKMEQLSQTMEEIESKGW